MKKEEEQVSNSLLPKLILVGAAIATIAIVVAVGFFLIYPTFTAVSSVNQSLDSERAKLAKIEQAINSLKTQNKTVLTNLTKFLDILVPNQVDMLHFATLNEIVAQKSGAQITNIQLSKGKTAISAKDSTKTSAANSKQTSQTAGTSATVTYNSNFDSLIKLIKFWFLADQIVGVNNIVISGQSSGVLNYTIIYDLPNSSKTTPAVVDDSTVLTKQQIEELKIIQNKVIYTATPSAKPLGKENPFLQ